MNKIDIQVVKTNIERKTVIDSVNINMGEKPSVWYSDCDSMTDYFHWYTVTIKEMIELLKTEGGDVVRVDTNYSRYNDPEGKELELLLRKINKIAKQSGYINKVKIEERIGHGYKGIEVPYTHVGGTFERMFEGVN